MAWNDAYYVPDTSKSLSTAVDAVDEFRQNRRDRAVGDVAATGKLSDAANLALKQGNLKTGLALKDLDDEKRAKVADVIGQAALNADTPEKWTALQASIQKRFPGEEVEPFESREGIVSMHKDYYKERQLSQQERQFNATQARLNADDYELEKVKGADGSETILRVNKRTGEAKPLDGQAGAGGTTGPDNPYYNGKFTGEQGKVAGFADRISEAEDIISENEAAGLDRTQSLKAQLPFGNSLVTPQYQKLEQAQRNFINSVLRRESGAVISDEEFDSARKQYFPQPGDNEDTLAQKRQNRKTAFESFARESGPNYKPKARGAAKPKPDGSSAAKPKADTKEDPLGLR